MNLIKKKQLFHYSFLIKKKGAVSKKKKKNLISGNRIK